MDTLNLLCAGPLKAPPNWLNNSGLEVMSSVPDKVASLLHQLDYSLQSNRKTREGASHPDRDAQFQHIHDQVQAFQARGQPVISVDTKKKEVIGNYKNDGQEWQRKKQPVEVNTHDFPDPQLGKVVLYEFTIWLLTKGG